MACFDYQNKLFFLKNDDCGFTQQRFHEMANNLVAPRFFFALIFILAENMQSRSSPLREATKRWTLSFD